MVALVGVGRTTAAVKTKAVPNTWLGGFVLYGIGLFIHNCIF